jgi:ATP-dependent Lhr-like helicase
LVEAARHPDFPMLLEATRECLRDVFDVPALREVMADLRARRTRLIAVDTDRASPFAQSLLFRWIAVYMYEGDAPLAERRAAALSLDRDLLREPSARGCAVLDPARRRRRTGLAARAGTGARPGRRRLLRELGPMRGRGRRAKRRRRCGVARDGAPRRTAVSRPRGGRERAAADGGRGDALGVSLPQVCLRCSPRRLTPLAISPRYARTHGPFVAALAARTAPMRCGSLETLEVDGRIVHGVRPAGAERSGATSTSADPGAVAALRQGRADRRHRARWFRRPGGRMPRSADALPAASVASRVALPASIWTAMSCPHASAAIVRPTSTALRERRAGLGGRRGGRRERQRVRLLFQERAALLVPSAPDEGQPAGSLHDAIGRSWPTAARASGG